MIKHLPQIKAVRAVGHTPILIHSLTRPMCLSGLGRGWLRLAARLPSSELWTPGRHFRLAIWATAAFCTIGRGSVWRKSAPVALQNKIWEARRSGGAQTLRPIVSTYHIKCRSCQLRVKSINWNWRERSKRSLRILNRSWKMAVGVKFAMTRHRALKNMMFNLVLATW